MHFFKQLLGRESFYIHKRFSFTTTMVQHKMKYFTLQCGFKGEGGGELFMAKKGLVFLHFIWSKNWTKL